jgi:NAD(P)H-dependent FMN reductase
MADVKVLALVGSLRAASVNRQLAELAADTAPDGVTVTVFDGLGELPFYNEDVDNEPAPDPVVALRTAAADADAALVVTPENNGSIPAVLKNAIDWLSRPFGQSVLANKPVAVIGAAAGHTGGARAHRETRKSFKFFGAGLPRVVESIELAVPIPSLDGKHPREHDHVVASLRDALGKLAADVG